MIKQIIEKYVYEIDGCIYGSSFPDLEQDLEMEMEKRAVAFGCFMGQYYADIHNPVIPDEQLYDRFKFEQWAEREGYVKDGAGWIQSGVYWSSDELLYTIFKQEAK